MSHEIMLQIPRGDRFTTFRRRRSYALLTRRWR